MDLEVTISSPPARFFWDPLRLPIVTTYECCMSISSSVLYASYILLSICNQTTQRTAKRYPPPTSLGIGALTPTSFIGNVASRAELFC